MEAEALTWRTSRYGNRQNRGTELKGWPHFFFCSAICADQNLNAQNKTQKLLAHRNWQGRSKCCTIFGYSHCVRMYFAGVVVFSECKSFRVLGCYFWDDNANVTQNPNNIVTGLTTTEPDRKIAHICSSFEEHLWGERTTATYCSQMARTKWCLQIKNVSKWLCQKTRGQERKFGHWGIFGRKHNFSGFIFNLFWFNDLLHCY